VKTYSLLSFLLSVLLLGVLSAKLHANLVITEILAVADERFPDDDGDTSDWIEIHNAGSESASLNGHFLTDGSDLTRWQFPDGITMEAGAYLVVFASGKDRADSTKPLHTNFSLSAGGEPVALVAPDRATILSGFSQNYPEQHNGFSYGEGSTSSTEQTFVVTGADSKWHVPLGVVENWTTPEYDDSHWNPAKTGIGFEYGELIGQNGDVKTASQQVNASIYVRIPFQIEDPTRVGRITLRLKYEDGFVAFINGTAVAASNAPVPLAFDSQATTSRPDTEAVNFADFVVAAPLGTGNNVLAVQVLNTSSGGSDLLMLPELVAEVSSGETALVYFSEPTPGEPNGTGMLGFAEKPGIDKPAGYYETPFQVTISAKPVGSTIRYTTDGSPPTEETGMLYTAPITIDGTTILRAASFQHGFEASRPTTRSYLFIEDILAQEDTSTRGAHWGTEMDPDVVNDTDQTWSVAEGLKDIPVLSIALPGEDLFDTRTGIYRNSTRRGEAWERACSAEYFYPDEYKGYRGDDRKGFTIDCGLVINGNYSRLTHNPKHSFRIKFKSAYGPSKLEFPLFPERGTEVFDTIAIRTGHNQGWATGIAETQMMRNQYSRDLQELDPKQFIARGNWVHLYLNGQYWGVYNFHERPDDAFGAGVYGGSKDEYDVHKGLRQGGSSQALTIAGNRSAWSDMFRIAGRNLQDQEHYLAIQEYLDIDQLIDYTIGLHYTGDLDGPTGLGIQATQPKNFYAVGRRHAEGRFRFFRWDSEFTLQSVSVDVTERRGTENPAVLHWNLKKNAEYRDRFANRVHRYFFNDGPLTAENAAQFYLDRIGFIDKAIVAESARWGDSKRSRPFTRDRDWIRVRDGLIKNWFPRRSGIVLGQWRKDDLYPNAEAPAFAINGEPLHGRAISSDDSLTLTLSENWGAAIYFTTDGSDPRLPQTPDAQPEFTLVPEDAPRTALIPKAPGEGFEAGGNSWTSPDFVESEDWLAGAGTVGFEASFLGGDYVEFIKFDVEEPMFGVTASALLRIPFELTEQQIAATQVLKLRARYDDGFVAYINGVRVASANAPTVLDGSEPATDSHLDVKAVVWEDFNAGLGIPTLRPGTNLLAIHALNHTVRGSDFLNSVQLTGQSNNTIAPSAQLYSGAMTLPESAVLRARALEGEEWSAMAEAAFQVDVIPASTANLVVSEIQYHPAEPSADEVAAGVSQRSQLEFIELMNVSANPIDLSAVAFTDGVEFDFTSVLLAVLAPGARGVIVADRAAFEIRYGTGLPVLGEFAAGTLSDGGETIAIRHGAQPDRQFAYDDSAPWPESADGDGFSLVLVNPASNPDPNVATNWRASTTIGGNPGTDGDTGSGFTAWLAENGLVSADGNPDGDSLANLLEYAFGLDPRDPTSVSSVTIAKIGEFIEIRYVLSSSAADVSETIESSPDLQSWSELTEGVQTSRDSDGTAIAVTHRITGIGSLPTHFRLRFVHSPPIP
jgi:hypothetical protein